MFEGTDGGVECMDVRRRERFGRARANRAFRGSGGVPTMGSKESLEIGGAMDFDIRAGLFEVNAVESRGQAKVFKRGVGFAWELELQAKFGVYVIGNGGRGASNGKIVHLTT